MNITVINLRTIEGITEYAEKFLMEEYGLALEVPVKINSRLTKTYGAMVESWNGKEYTPAYIEFAKRLIEFGHDDSITNTIKHELIHYALYKLNKPYDDGDEYFENELIKKCAPRSLEKTFVGKRYRCKCSKCDYTFIDTTKNQKNYHTRCCKAEIEVLSEVIADGFEIVKETPLKRNR